MFTAAIAAPIAHHAAVSTADAAGVTGGYAIGSHLVQGFGGTRPSDAGVVALKKAAEAGELTGVIFFSYNIEGPEQLRTLTRYMASWNVPAKMRPLLLMVDQEGGHVQRLGVSRGFHGWPAPNVAGQMPKARAQATFAGMAAELQEAGLNVNLAPVCDLWAPRNGLIGAHGRSFGTDVGHVAERASWQIDAQRRAGLISVPKHFPGHGLSRGDTHQSSVDATRSWNKRELLPFAQLIAANQIDLLMSAHLLHRGFEPSGAPMTFSRTLMQGTLREKMHYTGALMTDDLGMGAITQHYEVEQAVTGALGSGHDLLLFGLNEAAQGRGRERHRPIDRLFARAQVAVHTALASGSITPELLAQSDARLARLREKMQAMVPGVQPAKPARPAKRTPKR